MKPIFLIGYMGSGKSTMGRVLARMLGTDFIDLDGFIENRFHSSIKDLFAKRGEAGFRKIEQHMIEELSQFQDVVIACGGGTPCYGDNMEIMNANGITVYLQTSIERLHSRLTLPHAKAKRPIIAGKSDEELLDFIASNIAVRSPFYEKSQIRFDSTNIETAAETEVTAAELLKVIQNQIP